MARAPKAFAHGWLLPVSLVATLCLVLLMREAFMPARAVLTRDLGKEEVGTILRLEGGEDVTGDGYVYLGDEKIRIQRTTPDGGPVSSGQQTRDNPDTFTIVERGVHGTTPADHGVGDEVVSSDGIFFPQNNATFGDATDQLFYVILWVTGIAFILTEAFLLYCILGFKARPGERSHYTHGHHKLEMFWTVAIAVALLLLAIVQWDMWKEIKIDYPKPEEDPVRVQVLGKQFKWYFRHAGLDNEFGTADDIPELGTLKVPKGRKVAIEMRAQDVLHSLFLPNFRVKQDAVPGLKIPVWFEAMHTGTYPIMCAELCGLGHTTMGATLVVMEPADWKEWMEGKSTERRDEIVEYEMERPEWHSPENAEWWWWDRNPVRFGYDKSIE